MDLRGQHPTIAPIAAKIRLSILSTAVVDALGFANEFKRRFLGDFLSEMKPNLLFRSIPAGSWTDDTSLMLCLARSISTVGGSDGVDQMKRYEKWKNEGYLSSVGYCFDVGTQIGRAIDIFSSYEEDHALAFHRIRNELGGEMNSGNGSLMRILPIGLVCWRNVNEGKTWARECSQTTHPNTMCVEACQLWTCLIMKILEEVNKSQQPSNGEGTPSLTLSKLDLLEEISKFPFTDGKLRKALTVPDGEAKPLARSSDGEDLESWFCNHHPLAQLIATTQTPTASTPARDPSFPYTIPPVESLSSSGYVLNTIVAALYCFFATRTFEEGALMAVNLCDDADTVGAVYAGLAGCWYAGEKGSEKAERLFWSERVSQWVGAVKKKELVEQIAEELVIYESRKSFPKLVLRG